MRLYLGPYIQVTNIKKSINVSKNTCFNTSCILHKSTYVKFDSYCAKCGHKTKPITVIDEVDTVDDTFYFKQLIHVFNTGAHRVWIPNNETRMYPTCYENVIKADDATSCINAFKFLHKEQLLDFYALIDPQHVNVDYGVVLWDD